MDLVAVITMLEVAILAWLTDIVDTILTNKYLLLTILIINLINWLEFFW